MVSCKKLLKPEVEKFEHIAIHGFRLKMKHLPKETDELSTVSFFSIRSNSYISYIRMLSVTVDSANHKKLSSVVLVSSQKIIATKCCGYIYRGDFQYN